jgi:hypothetical protein
MNYQKTLLTYIDYLGFKNLVNSNKKSPNEIYEVLKSYIFPLQGFLNNDRNFKNYNLDEIEQRKEEQRKEIEETYAVFGQKFQPKEILGNFSANFYFFSDTVIRTTNLDGRDDDSIKLFLDLEIHFLCISLMKIINKGILLRGIITKGDNFQTEKVIFGPALINAYLMESKKVLYPRICIEKDIIINFINKDISDSSKYRFGNMLTQDFDGMFFIDYLKNLCFEIQIENYKVIAEMELKEHKALIENNLKEISEENENKIFWLKNYHNSTLIKNSSDFKKNIDINIEKYLIK